MNLRSDLARKVKRNATGAGSEYASITLTEYHNTPEGGTITKLDQILLNGNNVAMVGQLTFYYTFKLNPFMMSLYGVTKNCKCQSRGVVPRKISPWL